jgi:predicted small lipoprotein YifL
MNQRRATSVPVAIGAGLMAATLAGCGQKGPLVLPAAVAPPAASAAASAPAPSGLLSPAAR